MKNGATGKVWGSGNAGGAKFGSVYLPQSFLVSQQSQSFHVWKAYHNSNTLTQLGIAQFPTELASISYQRLKSWGKEGYRRGRHGKRAESRDEES
jgi:hypothetical protein